MFHAMFAMFYKMFCAMFSACFREENMGITVAIPALVIVPIPVYPHHINIRNSFTFNFT